MNRRMKLLRSWALQRHYCGDQGQGLYHAESNIGEKHNVAARYPTIDSLQAMAAAFRLRLGDSLAGIPGSVEGRG